MVAFASKRRSSEPSAMKGSGSSLLTLIFSQMRYISINNRQPIYKFFILYDDIYIKYKQHKKGLSKQSFGLEATPGFEPGMKVLQTSALPLGYVAL